MKLLRTMCVLSLALCLATSVYAGTQSVKISGDLTMRGLARAQYDLDHHHAEPATPSSSSSTTYGGLADNPYPGTSDWQTFFMTATEVQIDADLTDNVSAVVRLYNQRDWDVSSKSLSTDNRVLGRGEGTSYTQDPTEFDIGVDLAYMELKEFLYSPLTLRIGRQDIWFGKGFVVGANLKDYNANISADEYTVATAFDAIRATLDYDPWTIDGIAAKIWENQVGSKDDENLFGVNVGYVFDVYNAEVEGYWFMKDDGQIAPRIIKQHNRTQTIGLRGSADPLENWTAYAEAAFQFGHFVGFRDQTEKRGRAGWALDVGGECRYFKDMYPWKPVIGAEYILYSGDDDAYPTASSSGTFYGWDPMYRGKFDTAYREFVGKYNFTRLGWKGARTDYVNTYTDASYTNQHQLLLKGSVLPAESLTLDGRLAFFWQHHNRSFTDAQLNYPETGTSDTTSRRKKFMGTELDFELTWDYTEDVSFGLLGGWFFPGGFYDGKGDNIATDVVLTTKLSF